MSKKVIDKGRLRFNEETACCWGGPFDDYFAEYEIWDFAGWDGLKPLDYIIGLHHSLYSWYPIDMPTLDKPVALYLTGNDDTAKIAFFANKEEAFAELARLKACEPVDFYKDLYHGHENMDDEKLWADW